jgi:hypothetical protein
VAILFGDSNRLTLFICYPGSIEKLTLLGAIYYYYYYPSELFKCRQAERHVLLKPAIYMNDDGHTAIL